MRQTNPRDKIKRPNLMNDVATEQALWRALAPYPITYPPLNGPLKSLPFDEAMILWQHAIAPGLLDRRRMLGKRGDFA